MVTIQVSFLCTACGGWVREKGGEWKPPRLPCPAPCQGALQAPWNSLLNRYSRCYSSNCSGGIAEAAKIGHDRRRTNRPTEKGTGRGARRKREGSQGILDTP